MRCQKRPKGPLIVKATVSTDAYAVGDDLAFRRAYIRLVFGFLHMLPPPHVAKFAAEILPMVARRIHTVQYRPRQGNRAKDAYRASNAFRPTRPIRFACGDVTYAVQGHRTVTISTVDVWPLWRYETESVWLFNLREDYAFHTGQTPGLLGLARRFGFTASAAPSVVAKMVQMRIRTGCAPGRWKRCFEAAQLYAVDLAHWPLFDGAVSLPWDIMEQVLRCLPHNRYILNTAGIVNSQWFCGVLSTWDTVTVGKDYQRIPLLALRGARCVRMCKFPAAYKRLIDNIHPRVLLLLAGAAQCGTFFDRVQTARGRRSSPVDCLRDCRELSLPHTFVPSSQSGAPLRAKLFAALRALFPTIRLRALRNVNPLHDADSVARLYKDRQVPLLTLRAHEHNVSVDLSAWAQRVPGPANLRGFLPPPGTIATGVHTLTIKWCCVLYAVSRLTPPIDFSRWPMPVLNKLVITVAKYTTRPRCAHLCSFVSQMPALLRLTTRGEDKPDHKLDSVARQLAN